MKTCKSVSAAVLTALTLGLSWAAVQNCGAQTNTNLFPARINLVCVTTNQSGDLVYEPIKTSAFVEDCAVEMGVTNLTGLSLVFNRSNASLEVINRTNQTVLSTPLSFDGGISLTNSNHTRVEVETYVFFGTNTVASGLLSATERLTYGTSNQLTSFGLRGQLSYSYTDGTNSPTICRGTLLVGSALTADRDHDDDDDDNNGNHGNGNNGNHGQGNNGNHGKGKP